MDSVVLINGQWQGGADRVTLDGAKEIEDLYLMQENHVCVPVSSQTESLACAHDVIGYSAICTQTQTALALLRRKSANYVFTIGGGCDADVASILYANETYNGDLAVLWMDAHGDCNTPASSRTHLFYGMPIRALLGDCGKFFSGEYEFLKPDQLMHLGGRDIEPEEKAFLHARQIPVFSDMYSDLLVDEIVAAVQQTGKRNLYIHLDLDVLDPTEFPHVPVPVAGGLSVKRLFPLLTELRSRIHVVGFGLFEYEPCGRKVDLISQLVRFGLAKR